MSKKLRGIGVLLGGLLIAGGVVTRLTLPDFAQLLSDLRSPSQEPAAFFMRWGGSIPGAFLAVTGIAAVAAAYRGFSRLMTVALAMGFVFLLATLPLMIFQIMDAVRHALPK